MNKEAFRAKTDKVVGHIVHANSEALGNFLLDNIHYNLHGTKNLELARKHLDEGGSILYYFNHFAKLDPMLHGKIARKHLGGLKRTNAVMSYRHNDPKRGIFNAAQGMLMEDWHDEFGVNITLVIQEKDKEEYNKKMDAEAFNGSAMKKAIRFLRQPSHVLALAPEGTRSTVNELLEAEDGFEKIFKFGGKKVLALPVAAIHGPIRPYNTQTPVFVGKPFSYDEIQQESQVTGESVTELSMKVLADMLPENNRGYYL